MPCGLQGHYSRFAGYKKGFCCMGIDYEFVPEYKSGEQKHKDDKPFVWEIPDRLHNALDFSCETY